MKKTSKTYLLSSVALAGFLSLAASLTHAAEIDTNTARMQAMDKITGRVSVIDVPVNGTVNFGSFSILVRACKTRPPEDTPENFAFVDVLDNYNTENPVNIFRGWMISSSPALNPVEHPIYDVWLLKCVNTDVNPKKLLSAEQLKARDLIKKSSSFEENDKLKNSSEEEAFPPTEEASTVDEDVKEDTNPQTSSQLQPIEETKELSAEPINKPAEVRDIPDDLPPAEVEDGAPKSLLNINNDFEIDNESEETQAPSENADNIPSPKQMDVDVSSSNDILSQPQKDDNDEGFLSNFVFSEEETSKSAQDANASDNHANVVEEIDKELSDLQKQE